MSTAITIKPIDEIRSNLQKMESQFKAALPAHVTPEKFIRVAMTAIQSNSELLEADRNSLFAELTKCAADGLIFDGREAAIVVYRTKNGKIAKYLPMVGGILKKIRNSGELLNLITEVVFEQDTFDYWNDEQGSHLMHRPKIGPDRGERILTYAVATTKSGGTYIEIVTEEQMDNVRKVSRAKDTGPWSGDFADEMRKKTAIRRLSKRLPMSTDLEDVVQSDDDLTDFTTEPKKVSNQPTRLLQAIEAKEKPAETESSEITDLPNPFEVK